MTDDNDLYDRTGACLRATGLEQKLALTEALYADWRQGRLTRAPGGVAPPIGEPGRPERPSLVSPLAVERRSMHTAEGRAALFHSLAHIEFNAINLGLDAVYRFRAMPREFVDDWLQVAAEEAYHFRLLRAHLQSLGSDYGAFSAHNGLWEMAIKTAHDPLPRMALVPRVLEARGLDASPALIRKLRSYGDLRAVEILEIILRDEIGHVRIGNRWYHSLCAERGLEPMTTFRDLLREYGAPRLRPPLHTDARRAAGFSESEMAMLEGMAAEPVVPHD